MKLKVKKVWNAWPIWQVFASMLLLFIPLAFIRRRWYVLMEEQGGASVKMLADMLDCPDELLLTTELFCYMKSRPSGEVLKGVGGEEYLLTWRGILVIPPATGGKYILLYEDGTQQELDDNALGQIVDEMA